MNFLKRLFGSGCWHRFAWPRIDANDRHYQTCLRCGTAYEYDWKMMRRTGRLAADAHHRWRTNASPGISR